MGLVVFQSISKDMQTGMLEHIQLTPLSAHRILWGYLLGPSLSVLASFAAYTIVLLYTTLIYNLELTFFLTSQVVNFIGLMVFGLLAVYIGLLKGKNIISNFIVATLLMGLYFLGYVSEGTNVYSFLSSSFLLKLETYNYFFEYLLEYQQNKMVDPKSMLDIGPFSIGVLWVYIIFSALIIFGSWFYNLSIFRVRKSYWRSEIFLYLVYILIIILQILLKKGVENTSTILLEKINLWVITGTFIFFILASRSIATTKYKIHTNRWHYLLKKSSLFPVILFSFLGSITLAIIIQKMDNDNISQNKMDFFDTIKIMWNFIMVILGINLWIEIADKKFKKRKAAYASVGVLIVMLFPQFLLGFLLEDDAIAKLSSPILWSSYFNNDGNHLMLGLHSLLLFALLTWWYKLVIKPELNKI
ncbi:MAG: hypothetical protein KDD58_02420 [Bdellovibrionales bacterium]|nr:hypothetical protein [Bdellovibrionales bacterium]